MNLLLLTVRHDRVTSVILSLLLWSIIWTISLSFGIALGFAATLMMGLAIAFSAPVALLHFSRWLARRGTLVQVALDAEMLDWLRSNVHSSLYDVTFPTDAEWRQRLCAAILAGVAFDDTVTVMFADPRDAMMFKLVFGGAS